VFDPAKLEIQSRLEAAAFERLTPGLNLSAADVAPSPLPPGQIRFRLLRPEDLLVMEIETTDLQFEPVAARCRRRRRAPSGAERIERRPAIAVWPPARCRKSALG
jgi:hypothetical protein